MARKRMFSNSVIGSDDFLEMPDSSQNLYFHLSMQADDDGFVDNWKSIIRMTGKKEDDLKILVAKSFVIPFQTGVLVIRHWRINNYLKNDRYKETIYKNEKAMLSMDKNNVYNLDTECIQHIDDDNTQNKSEKTTLPTDTSFVSKMDTECILSIDKNRLDKISIDKNSITPLLEDDTSRSDTAKANTKHKYGEYKNVLLKDEELQALKKDYSNWEYLIKYLDEYIEMKGYKAKSHYLCIKKWVVDAVNKKTKEEKYGINRSNNANKYEPSGGLKDKSSLFMGQ